MKIQVQLFAALKQTVGSPAMEVELPAGASVAMLRQAMLEREPELANLLPHCRMAIDNEYAPDAAPLAEGANVACIPPVSGG